MPSPDHVGGYTFTYSPEKRDEPAISIVEAVAWVRDSRSSHLKPLHRIIDVDTLNELFGDRRDGVFYRRSVDAEAPGVELSFQYEGCEVRVAQDGIQVDPE